MVQALRRHPRLDRCAGQCGRRVCRPGLHARLRRPPLAPNPVQQVCLVLFSANWLAGVCAGMLVLLGFLAWMGWKSDLLRDRDLTLRPTAFRSSASPHAACRLALSHRRLLSHHLARHRPTRHTQQQRPGAPRIASGTALASKLANTFTLTDGAVPPDPVRASRAGTPSAVLVGQLQTQRTMFAERAASLEGNPARSLRRS